MSLQKLHSLVHQFNTHELTLIRYALKGSKDESGENKYLRLFEYVIKEHKTISRKAASMAIYHAMPDTRITKLAERLEEKILDIIISEVFLKKSDRINLYSESRIQTRKKALQISVLHYLNGTSQYLFDLIEKGIVEGKKSGLELALIDLFQAKRGAQIFYGTTNEYKRSNKSFEFYRKCYACSLEVLRCYNEIIKDEGFGHSRTGGRKRETVRMMILKLNTHKTYMQSIFTKYLFGLIRVEYFFLQENYISAKKLLHQQIRLIKSSILAGSNKEIILHNELCNCEIFLGNYKKAISQREKLTSIFRRTNKLDYYIFLHSLFYPVFYDNQYSYAIQILLEFHSDNNPIKSIFRYGKNDYFLACVHFQKNEVQKALTIVNQPSPLNKDKTGYDIAIRVLRIQSLLELEREDEAATQAENLRKHISRNYKRAYVSDRDKMIIRILQQMTRRGFSGNPYKAESEMIKKLSHNKGNFKWMPKTPELIRFHEWYADWQSRKSKGVLG